MVISLVLMVLAFFVLGVYAAQNSGTHDVVLFNQVWTGVPDWMPAVLAAAVMLVLMLLYAGYARVSHHVGRLSLRRRIDDNEVTMARLREENERLRAELDRREAGRKPETAPAAEPVSAGRPFTA